MKKDLYKFWAFNKFFKKMFLIHLLLTILGSVQKQPDVNPSILFDNQV